MARWEDAAFEQEHLLHNLDGYFGDLCDGYEEAAFGALRGDKEPYVLRAVHREMLNRADPMYVAHGPMTLWEHARSEFAIEPLQRTDLVAPCGFALLPWATSITDRGGKRVAFRAITWMPISEMDTHSWDDDVLGQGVWVSLLSHVDDIDDHRDDSASRQQRELGYRWSVMHGSAFGFGDRTWERFDGDDADTIVTLTRYILSFWRLMAQLVPVGTSLPRPWRRDRQRKKLVSHVTVIHLRRTREGRPHDEGDEVSIEYSHQWLVRGHWRNQPYGPRNGPKTYRQIWIGPYVKGPEDKPLIVKERVFEWTR